MAQYNPAEIEAKWQKYWEENDTTSLGANTFRVSSTSALLQRQSNAQ